MDTKRQKTKETYNAIAKVYTEDFGKDNEHFDIFIDRLISDLKSLDQTKMVIDLGSGPGNVIDYLLSHNISNPITAVELSDAFAEILQTKFKTSEQVRVIHGDMIKYVESLPSKSVAAYIANYSIIHIPDNEIEKLFRELKRTLVRNGIFTFSVWGGTEKGMQPEPYQVQRDSRLDHPEKLESYMNNFTEIELKKRLEAQGFKVLDIRSFTITPLPGEFNQPKIWVYVRV